MRRLPVVISVSLISFSRGLCSWSKVENGMGIFSTPISSRALYRNSDNPRCLLSMASSESEKGDSYNPLEDETPEERASRLELVRKLQQSFYKDETPALESETGNERNDPHSNVLLDLPLWRVQWKELPGSQNILNVHVPHYTNMFQKILKGQIKRWEDDTDEDNQDSTTTDFRFGPNFYFGHVFLPEGSVNLDNPDYALKTGETGVLMRISDCRQQMDDGRLTLIVQGLERFRISRVKRSHSPYAVADVEILPDREQILLLSSACDGKKEGTATTGEENWDHIGNDFSLATTTAVARAFEWHPFEVRRVTMEECEAVKLIDGSKVLVGISPLSNYDAEYRPKSLPLAHDNKTNPTILSETNKVALVERETWEKLNELLGWLSMAGQGVGIPVPTQILGLLPQKRCHLNIEKGILEYAPWPEDFYLGQVVAKMNGSRNTTVVGTHSKSPFVRVDDDKESSDEQLPMLRRAQRLSYVVWTLTDSISVGDPKSDELYDRQRLLQIRTTTERLTLAIEKMETICSLLRQILRRQG